ncbi:hypothetical protein [Agromyces seonyuensis]|uniref:Metallopeptidase family protein n=1 Tax=Agromyces seonyuensis TaxID=2662446 RepID=A0A6I4P5M4_9MICO|nr:hypothetical protein [Agromyces seonyuensis]MWB98857.1 hypothetical protein [Agromyces seonyuensis]
MPRPRRAVPASSRRLARDRHGRGMRSPVSGPDLPLLRTRLDDFDFQVASTIESLRSMHPDLDGVVFEVAQGPAEAIHDDHVDRWHIDRVGRRVTFFRLPIVRFIRRNEGDEVDERIVIESCVYRAVGDLLGKDPWDLAPGRYRGF